MRKWILILVAATLFLFPSQAMTQSPVTIASAVINLWPEYDRAEMLVINYILLTADTQLPATLNLRVPIEVGTPLVVAVGPSLDLVTDQNVKFTSDTDGRWLIVSIEATGPAIQFEYYDPALTRDGTARAYSYEWLSDHEVKNLSFKVQEPVDASDFRTSPVLDDDGIHQDQLRYYISKPVLAPASKVLSFELNYQKASDALSISRLQIQPAAPVDENTPGRVSLSNSLPYVIGGLGVILILGGLVYYWQAGRMSTRKTRRRVHPSGNDERGQETYCPQCGERARPGDRFCRVCGARLKHQEE